MSSIPYHGPPVRPRVYTRILRRLPYSAPYVALQSLETDGFGEVKLCAPLSGDLVTEKQLALIRNDCMTLKQAHSLRNFNHVRINHPVSILSRSPLTSQ